MQSNKWKLDSWKKYDKRHMPNWDFENEKENITSKLKMLPSLVSSGECDELKNKIINASYGNSFILQCGDCAEEFNGCNEKKITSFIRLLMQMATIMSFEGGMDIVNIGRVAGQYAKPRTNETEVIHGIKMPTYKGDLINSYKEDLVLRTPNPNRMLKAYHCSAATINHIVNLRKSSFGDQGYIMEWFKDYKNKYEISDKYEPLLKALESAENINWNINKINRCVSKIYTSHEALVLDYEQSLTRKDNLTGEWYDTSAHFLWIGDRTRCNDSAHVEFIQGIKNPIGIKVGRDFGSEDLIETIKKLNPRNERGKLTLITRFGVEYVEDELLRLISIIKKHGLSVSFSCDPMHGNTFALSNMRKTRKFEDILKETELCFKIHKESNTILSGIHLEITEEMVTECLGEVGAIHEENQHRNYTTKCDPRLNFYQAVEFSYEIGKFIKKYK